MTAGSAGGWLAATIIAASALLTTNQPASADWATSITRGVARSLNQRLQDQIQKEAEKSSEKNYKQIAAINIIAAYKKSGMIGIIIDSDECYKSSIDKKYCIYFDLGGMHISNSVSDAFGFPINSYYEDENVERRLGKFSQELITMYMDIAAEIESRY